MAGEVLLEAHSGQGGVAEQTLRGEESASSGGWALRKGHRSNVRGRAHAVVEWDSHGNLTVLNDFHISFQGQPG